MSFRFFFVISTIFFSQTAATLGDRLLLEINNASYTQRQLESHTLVRTLMQKGYRAQAKPLISAQNWRNILHIFQEDMLILQEIERHGWYKPAQREIEEAKTRVLQNLGKMRSNFLRLGIDDNKVIDLVVTNLKIELYRQNQRAQKTGEQSWLDRLKEKNFVRFYLGSSVYLTINPQVGAGIP